MHIISRCDFHASIDLTKKKPEDMIWSLFLHRHGRISQQARYLFMLMWRSWGAVVFRHLKGADLEVEAFFVVQRTELVPVGNCYVDGDVGLVWEFSNTTHYQRRAMSGSMSVSQSCCRGIPAVGERLDSLIFRSFWRLRSSESTVVLNKWHVCWCAEWF